MDIDFWSGLFLFLSGAIAHAFAVRIMSLYSRIRVYRVALVNCLSIIKFVSNHVETLLVSTCSDELERQRTSSAVSYWREMSVVALKNSTPDGVWQNLGIKDWREAEKLVKKFESLRGEDE
jgi:hypothetical protein